MSGDDVPCVVCGAAVKRSYERHRYCSVACWDKDDPANARHAIPPDSRTNPYNIGMLIRPARRKGRAAQ
jgi:endogenous inhibitor of DNA gyrase (YacG/DUF329 family)